MSPRWTQAAMREVATQERAELGLNVMDPLDPYALCQAHGIDVLQLDQLLEYGCAPESVHHFKETSSSWSAALIPVGTGRVILENETHTPQRRRANIAHELGHHLLEQEFAQVLTDRDHRLLVDPKMEKEALLISGELLVPSDACKRMAFQDWTNDDVAAHFIVSTQFAQMRMSGPRKFAERARAKQARTPRRR